ncbi:autotransporter domain-containing protein [uncultured Sphingomonas sp.]|uniref:autotransporter domain-containing protein n=1 Tax=uncultured Sphingomonas sp. TaxID=158754 RepID=UPI0035CA3AA7
MRYDPAIFLSSVAMIALTAPAAAQTTISTSTSVPVSTGTAASGAPSDVVIGSGVTITAPSGTAVTINSNNSATNNGTITFTGVENSTGIGATTGLAGTIANTGTITNTETSTAVDENADGNIDGPFATGANRYGIHVTGAGTFAGGITNSGTITIVGNTSAGIAVDDTLAGTIANTGTITVSGANSYGIHAGTVTGNVTSSGAITATGQGAVGIALDGDVGGTVTLSSSVTATGFRGGASVYATPIPDDLYIGGPAMRIAGNVAGGVSLATGSALTSYGSAPGLLIGSATRAITLSPVSGSPYGLVIAGSVTGAGVNLNVDGTGVAIGGLGGATTIAGGIGLSGTIVSSAYQSNATGLTLGAGASTPTLAVTGTITATGGVGVFAANAVAVQAGASLPSITNTGTLAAISNGNTGTATAIRDLSGTLTSIVNSGQISATLAGTYLPSQATAIDLSANTTGVTITNALASSTSTVIPHITGAVLTGSGNDTVAVSAGTLNGAVSLGAGTNTLAVSGTGGVIGAVDLSGGVGTVALSGAGALTGNVTFGAGSSMTLAGTAVFTGAVVQNGNPIALTIGGGTFNATNTGTIALSSLSVGSTGTFRVNLDPTTGINTLYAVSGAATIASGATVALNITHFLPTAQSYTILTAGSLTGGSGLSVQSSSLPYIYAAALTANTGAGAGTVVLAIQPKTPAQLGLNRSGTAAYVATYAAEQTDATVQSTVLSINSDAQFRQLASEMLPEHAGGMFLSTIMVSQAVSDFEAQASAPRATSGRLGLWVMQAGSLLSKSQGDTQPFHLSDYGLGIGAEYGLGALGTVGLAYDWSYNRVTDPENANELNGYMSEFGAYWRAGWGGLKVHAHGAWGHVAQGSLRELLSPTSNLSVLETAGASWTGTTIAAGGGGSYEAAVGRLRFRPAVTVDYFRLDDGAHTETGGGTAFDLSIAERRSKAVTGTYSLNAGYVLTQSDDVASRIEIEVGDRQRLSGSLADTVASYAGGQAFTLQADALRYGPQATIRLAIGSNAFSVVGEAKAQKTQGMVAESASVGLHFNL